MTERELINKIADDLRTQGFFQREDYCEVSHEEQAELIMRSVQKANYVRLADDQNLPELPKQHQRRRNVTDIYSNGWRDGYAWLITKIQEGWRKVEL